MPHVYVHRYMTTIKETYQTLFERGGERESENGNKTERVNLFKINYAHVWNYHKASLIFINI
jgi:hypothetical protein